MFSNAFLSTREESAIPLLAASDPSWTSVRDVRRTIERWQTKAFVQAALETLNVANAYRLEEALMKDQVELAFPIDRPKLFDRMGRLGEPAIAKQLGMLKGGTKTALWLRRLLRKAPSLQGIAQAPIWRLLDPTPMTYVECTDVTLGVVRQAVNGNLAEKIVASGCWKVRVFTSPKFPPLDYYISRAEKWSRWGLTRVLLDMRRSETQGDMLGYYLNLLEAADRCSYPGAEPDLALLHRCGEYLTHCFGQIHIADAHPWHRRYQTNRLEAARTAFFRAKEEEG